MKNKLDVLGKEIKVTKKGTEDFLSLTEIYNGFGKGGSKSIETWIRSGDIVTFLGSWEKKNNPNFKAYQLVGLIEQTSTRTSVMSVSKWVEEVNAIGIYSVMGRWGGTYAHSTIALRFCAYLDSDLEVAVYEDYLRYKKEEYLNQRSAERQEIADDYKVMGKSIQDVIVSKLRSDYDKNKAYSTEANMLNVAVFGMTAQEWKDTYPHLVTKNRNQRDYCSPAQMDCLHKVQLLNSFMIDEGLDYETRKLRVEKQVEKVMPILIKSKGILTNRPISELN